VFSDAEADQLQPIERTVGEVELDVGQLARRVAFVVRSDCEVNMARAFLNVRRRAGLAAGSR